MHVQEAYKRMDKLIVDVGKIRGLGNIVSPKSSSDFEIRSSKITSSNEIINQENTQVFLLNYLNGSKLNMVNNNWIEYSSDMTSFIVTCKLLYHTGNVIYSAPVTCTINDTTILNGTTDNMGLVNFTIPLQPSVSTYKLKITYNGNSNVAAYTLYTIVRVGNITGLNLTSNKNTIQAGDTCYLLATLTGTNTNGEIIPIQGQKISIYEEYPASLRLTSDKDAIQAGETTNITAQLIDSVDGGIVALNGMPVKIYTTIPEGGLIFTDPSEHSYTNAGTIVYESLTGSLIDLTEDWILEFDMKNNTGSGGINIGATQYHRPPDSANYRLFIGTDGTSFNFNNRTLQSNHSNTGTRETGTFYHFKLVKTGTNVSAYYDDNLIATKNITWWNDYDSFEVYFISWGGISSVKNLSLRTIQ